jgi:hypothetical protein
MEKFIILITGERGNATLRGSPLRLYHYDDIEVEAAIAWQVSGGFARSGMCVIVAIVYITLSL